MKKTTIPVVVLLASIALIFGASICGGQTAAQSSSAASDPMVDAYINSMRADFNVDKIALITDAMQFTDKDAAAFWPVYKKYQAEVIDLNDERVQLIKAYADKYMKMTNAEAKDLAMKSFDLETRRAALRKQYFVEFNKVLPALTVAKFFQLEHRLDLVVDLKLAAALPSLLEKDPGTKPN